MQEAQEGAEAVKCWMRRKEIRCGKDYLEIDVFPYTSAQENAHRSGKRKRKEKVSAPKQKSLNDKNARRYLIQKVNTNFGSDDLHITATYKDKFLPATIEDAEREARNYLNRLDYRRKKEGLTALKYILVTEYSTGQDGEKPVRIHHHIIVNGGLDRDIVESLWCRRKKRGEKQGERLGYVNADRLQPDENGMEALCSYLTKYPNRKKRWTSSHNLQSPECWTNDHEFSRRQVERLAKDPESPEFWENRYPEFYLTEFRAEYNDATGWALYAKMRRNC